LNRSASTSGIQWGAPSNTSKRYGACTCSAVHRARPEPDEALIVRVVPPSPCAYWDVQVGNGWYESFDYRQHFSGLTCDGAHIGDNGTVILVLSEHDPGTVNWLETVGHRAGHIAIRWQLTKELPVPETQVVPVGDVATVTGLPRVSPEQRSRERAALRSSFDARFCR
jgi:hypothetical protein